MRNTRIVLKAFAVFHAVFLAEIAIAEPLKDTPRTVLAHYMTCYHASVDFYKSEIELAQRNGIDGFAMNCGAWLGNRNYIEATERMYQAAKEMNSSFKLLMSGDAGGRQGDDVFDMVKRFAEHPNQFRHNGAIVISAWASQPGTMEVGRDGQGLKMLRDEGYDVCLVPDMAHPRWSINWSMEANLKNLQADPATDGLFWFGPDATVSEILRNNATRRRAMLLSDKICMAGVSPCYNSANLRGHYGIEGYAAMWEGVVRDNPEWVEIVTWNDYNEDSHLMPYRWQRGWEKQYNDHDETYLNATAYYAAWFKSGQRPTITQDKLFYAYRTRSHWLRRAWDWKANEWIDLTTSPWPFDQIHDDAEDTIYVTTFLTEPATLTVELAGKTHTFEQPAGVAHARVPLAGGVPQFDLVRKGRELLSFAGRKRIVDSKTQTEMNSAKGYHLLNRTFTGGGAVGKVVKHLEAESGELLEGAKVVDVAGAKTVQNEQQPGSGVKLPLRGLRTATYNVRVRYSNPSGTEARLTMMADGPPRAENDYPHYIPLSLPPTAQGEFKTISFLWSLYDHTTWLKIQWMENDAHGRNVGHPQQNDLGQPMIDWINLVKVEPTEMPKPRDSIFPEMVPIPGGKFTMGDNEGRPDERPAHEVSVSPLAMSRFEITNEQYERFDPEHRVHRDGYSWRDREPVIYVSWLDGVKYCNWLSSQAGLRPAYREEEREIKQGDRVEKRKVWTVDLSADGFRLPTEAEWEYVAQGRGENRRFPWGDEPPTPGVHAHWSGAKSLAPDPRLPSQYAAGAMVVGSFPKGASRDGVMDLVGNVCEWCSDWLEPYTDKSERDPVGRTPGNYRSIRGSSWGYYGHPAEVVDREYNNPKYPGYVYIGLRVVLPEAGWRKVQRRR